MDTRATVMTVIYTIIFVSSLNIDRAVSKDTFIWQLANKSVPQGRNDVVIGLLEVRKNQGKWMKICDSWTDNNVTNVSCRQMGFLGAIDTNVQRTQQAGIFLQKFSCQTGSEQNITFCNVSMPSSDKCPITSGTASLAVQVTCKTNAGLSGLLNVELLGGSVHDGTLVYTHIGKKTPVCYNDSNAESVASVVCKQMGYSDKIKVSSVAPNETAFASLECSGSEQTLDACSFKNHVPSCTQGSVVAVECKLNMTSQKFFDIRLSSPDRSPSNGTVEVRKYGYWGVICHNDWTIEDANVVCRQLGYRKATDAPKNAWYGQGTGIVFWDKMMCTGNEFSIAECPHTTAVVSATCDSTKAAGVSCDTNDPLPTFDICSNETITIPADDSFLRSPGYPNLFHYEIGTTCSCTTNLNAATTLTLYIHQKMFKQNHVESLTFYNDSSEIRLYGDDSSAGPFSFTRTENLTFYNGTSEIQLHGDDSSAGPFNFTDTDNFTIQFESDKSAGEGLLNIQIKATEPVEFACTMTVKVPSTTRAPTTAGNYGTTGSPALPTGGGVIYGPGVIAAIVIGVVLCCGIIIGVLIWWFNKKKKSASKKITKRSNSVGSFDQTGDGSKQGVHNPNCEDGMKKNEIYETANEKGNIQGGTPGVTADIYAKVTPKSERSKEPETGEMNQNGKDRPASGSHVKVCIVNPVFNTDEGRPSQHNGSPRVEFDAQDIDNGNVEDEGDINSPAMLRVVNESHKSPAFIPGLSTAYEEVGFGGASSMQTQPNEETPEKDEKKKKKKKKDKSEDTNKKKKKRSFGTADDHTGHPDGQRNSGSCAVPITGINAEAGQKTGSQPDDSEDMYDHLNRKGTTPAPSGCDQIYDTAKY